jgi:integrase
VPRKNPKNEKYELVGEIISIYRRDGSTKWYAYWRVDGRPHRKSLATEHVRKARKRALELEKQLLAGEASPPQQAVGIDEAIEEYIAYLRGQRRSSKTIGKYQHCFIILKKLAEERGLKRLSQVDHRVVDAFRNLRSESSKPKTVANDLVTIRQLINFGLQRKLLREDPLHGLQIEKAPATPQPFWTAEQVEEILAATKASYQAYFRFLAYTGARAGEAIWLTWEDVDFDNGVIHIRPKDGWKPKTGDQRVVPLGPELRSVLMVQPRCWRWVFTARPSAKCPVAGRQISDRRALSHLKTVLKRLQLNGHQHTFRHSFISYALTQGVPEPIVRKWVGHVDARIMKTYTHIADQISQQAMLGLFNKEGQDPRQERRTSA